MVLTDRRARDLSFFELGRLMRYFAVQNPATVSLMPQPLPNIFSGL